MTGNLESTILFISIYSGQQLAWIKCRYRNIDSLDLCFTNVNLIVRWKTFCLLLKARKFFKTF